MLWLRSRGGGDSVEEMSVTLGLLSALALHLVAFGAVAMVPRGRRWLPALMNLLPVALIAATLIVGSALR